MLLIITKEEILLRSMLCLMCECESCCMNIAGEMINVGMQKSHDTDDLKDML